MALSIKDPETEQLARSLAQLTGENITMATGATIGLAVTSHNDGTLCTANFSSVTATP